MKEVRAYKDSRGKLHETQLSCLEAEQRIKMEDFMHKRFISHNLFTQKDWAPVIKDFVEHIDDWVTFYNSLPIKKKLTFTKDYGRGV